MLCFAVLCCAALCFALLCFALLWFTSLTIKRHRHVCTHARTHARAHTQTHTHTQTDTNTHTHIHAHAHAHAHAPRKHTLGRRTKRHRETVSIVALMILGVGGNRVLPPQRQRPRWSRGHWGRRPRQPTPIAGRLPLRTKKAGPTHNQTGQVVRSGSRGIRALADTYHPQALPSDRGGSALRAGPTAPVTRNFHWWGPASSPAGAASNSPKQTKCNEVNKP
jgi:hypothetical protein